MYEQSNSCLIKTTHDLAYKNDFWSNVHIADVKKHSIWISLAGKNQLLENIVKM